MDFKERQAFNAQQRLKFNQLPEGEQAKLAAERDFMWSQIPAHLQEKAKKLAGR